MTKPIPITAHDHGNCELCDQIERDLSAANEKLAAMDRENARLLGEIAATCLKRKEAVRKCERIAQEYPFSPVA